MSTKNLLCMARRNLDGRPDLQERIDYIITAIDSPTTTRSTGRITESEPHTMTLKSLIECTEYLPVKVSSESKNRWLKKLQQDTLTVKRTRINGTYSFIDSDVASCLYEIAQNESLSMIEVKVIDVQRED